MTAANNTPRINAQNIDSSSTTINIDNIINAMQEKLPDSELIQLIKSADLKSLDYNGIFREAVYINSYEIAKLASIRLKSDSQFNDKNKYIDFHNDTPLINIALKNGNVAIAKLIPNKNPRANPFAKASEKANTLYAALLSKNIASVNYVIQDLLDIKDNEEFSDNVLTMLTKRTDEGLNNNLILRKELRNIATRYRLGVDQSIDRNILYNKILKKEKILIDASFSGLRLLTKVNREIRDTVMNHVDLNAMKDDDKAWLLSNLSSGLYDDEKLYEKLKSNINPEKIENVKTLKNFILNSVDESNKRSSVIDFFKEIIKMEGIRCRDYLEQLWNFDSNIESQNQMHMSKKSRAEDFDNFMEIWAHLKEGSKGRIEKAISMLNAAEDKDKCLEYLCSFDNIKSKSKLMLLKSLTDSNQKIAALNYMVNNFNSEDMNIKEAFVCQGEFEIAELIKGDVDVNKLYRDKKTENKSLLNLCKYIDENNITDFEFEGKVKGKKGDVTILDYALENGLDNMASKLITTTSLSKFPTTALKNYRFSKNVREFIKKQYPYKWMFYRKQAEKSKTKSNITAKNTRNQVSIEISKTASGSPKDLSTTSTQHVKIKKTKVRFNPVEVDLEDQIRENLKEKQPTLPKSILKVPGKNFDNQ